MPELVITLTDQDQDDIACLHHFGTPKMVDLGRRLITKIEAARESDAWKLAATDANLAGAVVDVDLDAGAAVDDYHFVCSCNGNGPADWAHHIAEKCHPKPCFHTNGPLDDPRTHLDPDLTDVDLAADIERDNR